MSNKIVVIQGKPYRFLFLTYSSTLYTHESNENKLLNVNWYEF